MTDRTRLKQPMMILVAGSALRATANPATLTSHQAAIQAAATDLFLAGHTPITGQDLAASLASQVAPDADDAAPDINPYLKRLLVRCDAVLRVGDPSDAVDELTRLALWEGKTVYQHVGDIAPRSHQSTYRS